MKWNKVKISWLLKWIITFAFFILFIRFFQLNLDKFLTLRPTHPGILGLGMLMAVVNFVFEFIKLRWFTMAFRRGLSYQEIMKAMCIGYVLGFVTPGNVGSLGKGLFLPTIGKLRGTLAVLADRMVTTSIIFVWGTIALILLADSPFNPLGDWAWKVIGVQIVVLTLLGVFFLFPEQMVRIFIRFPYLNRLKNHLPQAAEVLHSFSLSRIIAGAVLATLWLGIVTVEYGFLLSAFGQNIDFYVLLFIPVMLMLKIVLPLTVGDLGVREGLLLFLFKVSEIVPEVVFLVSLTVFFLNSLIPSAWGLYFLRRS